MSKVRADQFSDRAGDGAPDFPYGLTTVGVVTATSFSGSIGYATSAGISTYASTAGISTYATSAGISTYATSAGISTSAQGLTGTPSIVIDDVDVSGAYKQTIQAVSALDIDCSTGNYFTKTITTGTNVFTFSNAPASRAYSFTLELTHTGGTAEWPSSVKWPADTAPTLNTGVTHLLMFVTDDGGTRWRAAALANYVN